MKMVATRWAPFALAVIGSTVTSTVLVAQDTLHQPLQITPQLNSSAPLILRNQPEVAVSPAMPSTLLSPPTMTNPLTGLPCSGGAASLAIGGTGTPPVTNEFPDAGEQLDRLQAPSSVFGSESTQGPC
jgi:hypothetical protein